MSILNHIKSGVNPRALGICVYGEAGTGKTTFASHFPSPLFLDTEQGSDHFNVDRLAISSWEDFMIAIRDLEAATMQGALRYKTIVVDTLDHLWAQAADYVTRSAGKKSIEDFGYGKGYVMTTDEFKSAFSSMKNIIAHGVNVALMCHCKVDRISPPDAPEFARYCPKINAPNKQADAARDFIQEWVDGIYFCQIEVTVNSAEKKAVGGQNRVLHTSSNAAWIAKSRRALPEKMPLDAGTAQAIFGIVQQAQAPASAHPVPVPVPQPVAELPSAQAPQMNTEAAQHPVGQDDSSVIYRYLVATGQLQSGNALNSLPNYETLKANWDKVAAKARHYFASLNQQPA